LVCGECDGLGFDTTLKKYKMFGKSILDIWNMTLNEGISYFEVADKKIAKKLMVAQKLSLGHLKIGQATSTLSGGENIRIKLIRVDSSSASCIGDDEPFKGLNSSEIFQVVKYLIEIRDRGKTIVVVDHTEVAIPYFDQRIKLKVDNGIIGEKVIK
jgi:excinuclease UvrABC ATPase subunit